MKHLLWIILGGGILYVILRQSQQPKTLTAGTGLAGLLPAYSSWLDRVTGSSTAAQSATNQTAQTIAAAGSGISGIFKSLGHFFKPSTTAPLTTVPNDVTILPESVRQDVAVGWDGADFPTGPDWGSDYDPYEQYGYYTQDGGYWEY